MTEPQDQPADALLRARAFLAAHKAGTLEFDDHHLPLRFVIDPADGRLCAPVMVATLLAAQHVLHVPEETNDPFAMRLLLSPDQLDDDPPIADRWRIYHGEPEDLRWAAFWIDFAKWDGLVIDGDPLMSPHPFAADAPAILKELNAHPDRLRSLCAELGDVRDVEAPVAVGIDPLGVDVRARFDIVRLPFDSEALSPDEARAAISAFMS